MDEDGCGLWAVSLRRASMRIFFPIKAAVGRLSNTYIINK
jgi:hypothetical protein